MGELEDFKKEFFDSYKDKFVIYEVDGGLDEVSRGSIEWAGDDYEEFLSFAEKLGAKIIYYGESFSPNEHPDNPKYNEDIAEINIGFTHDGILHTFSSFTSWYEKELEEENPEEEETEIDELGRRVNVAELRQRENSIKELNEKPPDELAKEMVEFAYKEFPDSLTEFYNIADAFWQSKGLRVFSSDAKSRLKMDKVKQMAEKEVMSSVISKEKEQLPKIIEECISWAKGNGFNKLTRANLQAFLLEKELNLSYQTQDALYIKANFELKKKSA